MCSFFSLSPITLQFQQSSKFINSDSQSKYEETLSGFSISFQHVCVKGKLVQCKLSTWGSDSVIKQLGGIGTIIESEVFLDTAQIFMAPATMVNSSVGETINNYIHSTRSPSAVIYKSEEVKIPAPVIATFSSRGPNPGTKHVLKPDIAAPGFSISFQHEGELGFLIWGKKKGEITLLPITCQACDVFNGIF